MDVAFRFVDDVIVVIEYFDFMANTRDAERMMHEVVSHLVEWNGHRQELLFGVWVVVALKRLDFEHQVDSLCRGRD